MGGWHGEEGWPPGSSDGEGGSPLPSQQDPEAMEEGEAVEEGEEWPPAVWRYARPPPTQVCAEQGMDYAVRLRCFGGGGQCDSAVSALGSQGQS